MPRGGKIIPNSERTPEERKKIARLGGKRSGEVRREKKLLSQVYADMLSEKYGKGEKGVDLQSVVKGILADGGAPAVSMLREIREATEGSKSTISNPDGSPLIPSRVEFVVVDSENRDSATVRADNDTVEI